EDLEHPVEAPRERPRGREEVARDEKATRRLSRDLHLEDTGCASVGRLTWYARRQAVTVASRFDGGVITEALREDHYRNGCEARSSRCIVASERLRPTAFVVSTNCSGLEAPMMGAVTSGCASSQATAS